jgi:quercetin dioxygenase-like cupin family protein
MKLFGLILFFASSAFAVEAPVVHTVNDANLKWGPCPEIFPKGCEMTVIHGAPAQANADVYMKVPANYTIPAHSHTSPEHMTLVKGQLNVKYKGSEPFTLNAGNYAYGPAGIPHEAKCVGTESCVLEVGFEKPVDAKAFKGKL